MRTSRVNTNIAQRIKQVVVLFILILAGIIVTLSAEAAEAKVLSPNIHDRYTIIKKQNKVYSNACALLKEKRNKKEKAKVHKNKYR